MKNRHSKLSYKSELLYRGTKNPLNFSGGGESNEVQKNFGNCFDGASWTKTVSTNTIRLSNTKTGL